MEGKLIFTITISPVEVVTNMSADKLENMEIGMYQQILKACTDTCKRIKRIMGMDGGGTSSTTNADANSGTDNGNPDDIGETTEEN